MRPSAKVWKGISAHLNRRRRRFGFLLGTSLLLTATLGYYLEKGTPDHYQTVQPGRHAENKVTINGSAAPEQGILPLVANTTPQKKTKTMAVLSPTRDVSLEEQSLRLPERTFFLNETATENSFTPTIVDSYKEPGGQSAGAANDPAPAYDNTATSPQSIESVLNTYKRPARKLRWQTYFTPTVSYRKLNDNYIDNVAPHKPAFGFEMGMAAKYAVSKKASLRGGLQFNVNRYDIKTFDSYAQMATIRLVDRNGVDFVSTLTNYNNYSGYKSNWLQNFYFQVSAPVGVELKIKGDDKMQFGVAGTVQPTYLLSDKTYLISTDYKNYAEMPELVRRWNVNTSLETFVAYSTGHLNWQVGPQVRYQILSSYLKKYPVKENLFDFGLKIGISINKP